MLRPQKAIQKLGHKTPESVLDGRQASPEMRHIRVLENRLDKTMIKYNEADSCEALGLLMIR